MKLAIITINQDGKKLAKKLKAGFPDAKILNGKMTYGGALKDLVKRSFGKYDGLIFICALGITVRLINGLIKTKFNDPAVVAVDTAGRFAISVLAGHEGGANRLAYLVAAGLDALPVITTGTESHKKIILGIGTRRGIAARNVKSAIKKALKKKGVKLDEIRLAVTIDLKRNEAGLISACHDLGLPLVFIPAGNIKNFCAGLSGSEVVRRRIGLDGVCEPCALLAGRRTKLILKKEILEGVTVALAMED